MVIVGSQAKFYVSTDCLNISTPTPIQERDIHLAGGGEISHHESSSGNHAVDIGAALQKAEPLTERDLTNYIEGWAWSQHESLASMAAEHNHCKTAAKPPDQTLRSPLRTFSAVR